MKRSSLLLFSRELLFLIRGSLIYDLEAVESLVRDVEACFDRGRTDFEVLRLFAACCGSGISISLRLNLKLRL